MKTKHLLLLCFSAVALGFTACSSDDPPVTGTPAEIIPENGVASVMQLDTLPLKVLSNVSTAATTYTWEVNGVKKGTGETFKLSSARTGTCTVLLTVSHPSTGEAAIRIKKTFIIMPRFADGAFILNEGNAGNETGTLSYIDLRRHVAIDSVYQRVNGSKLGNVCQGLFIANQKMYIISQNGAKNGGEGLLTIARANSLEKVKVYNNETLGGANPTNVAVVGDHIYLTTYGTGKLFHLSEANEKLTEIAGVSKVSKLPMVVIGKKLFAMGANCVYVVEGEECIATIPVAGKPSGIQKGGDGNLWLSYTSPGTICRINPKDYSVIASHAVTPAIQAGWGCAPAFYLHKDQVYFVSAGTKLYKHDFTANTTTQVMDLKTLIDSNIFYNGFGVDPVSGAKIYTAFSDYGKYKENKTCLFDVEGSGGKKFFFDKLTAFPAGVFFTSSFQ